MAELVGEDSLNLCRRRLLNERVVEDNLLGPGETVEVSVRVRRALAAIDDVEVLEGELELGGERLDTGADLASGNGGELVEQGLDWSKLMTRNPNSLRMGKMIWRVSWTVMTKSMSQGTKFLPAH